jgi:hypothetical protein
MANPAFDHYSPNSRTLKGLMLLVLISVSNLKDSTMELLYRLD